MLDLFGIILLGTLYAFCTWISVSFQDWEYFSRNLIKYTLNPLCLPSPSGTPIMQIFVYLILSQRFLKLFSFFLLFFFLLIRLGDFHYSIFNITFAFCIT